MIFLLSWIASHHPHYDMRDVQLTEQCVCACVRVLEYNIPCKTQLEHDFQDWHQKMIAEWGLRIQTAKVYRQGTLGDSSLKSYFIIILSCFASHVWILTRTYLMSDSWMHTVAVLCCVERIVNLQQTK